MEPPLSMPVSILCFMELMGPVIPDGFLDTLDRLFTSQDDVVAQYIESYSAPPSLASHRGLTLYQQAEDPRIILGSGQWPSSALCAEWFARQAPEFMRELEGLHRPEAMETALVDGFIFSDVDSGAPTPLFDAARLELTRWRVPAAKGPQFEQAVGKLAGKKQIGGNGSVFRSRRLDDWPPRADADVTWEFFLLASGDVAHEEGSAEEKLCEELAESVEKKHYSKAL
jgi:hypothetical protein